MSRKRAEILVTQSLGPINDPILVQDHVVPGTPSSCWMRASLCRCLTVDRLSTLTKAHVGREVGVALVGAVTLL